MATVELLSVPFVDTCLFQFPALRDIPGFRHVITSRPWNMSTHTGPETELAAQRRKRICDFLELPFTNLIAPDQVHSPHVIRLTESDRGCGRDCRETAIKFVDGLICDLPNVPIMQFSADCPIVVVVHPQRRIIGTAHASWRGTTAQITEELMRKLLEGFDIDPTELLAAICPCAGPGEYEVGVEVQRVALNRLPNAEQFFRKEGGSLFFDLRAANVDQLVRHGLRRESISVASNSTMTDSRFYSHRREGERAGRFAFIAGFRE